MKGETIFLLYLEGLYMSDNDIKKIEELYSLKTFLIFNVLGIVTLITFYIFPIINDCIQYPIYAPIISFLTIDITFLTSIIIIKMLAVKKMDCMLKCHNFFVFYFNFIIAIVLPALSKNITNVFWISSVINCFIIFLLQKYSYKINLITVGVPFYSLILHYIIWNIINKKNIRLSDIAFSTILSIVLFFILHFITIVLYEKTSQVVSLEVKEKFVLSFELTKREQDVILKILEGYSVKEIAYNLYISQGTAKAHIINILRKTKSNSRIELLSKFNKFCYD